MDSEAQQVGKNLGTHVKRTSVTLFLQHGHLMAAQSQQGVMDGKSPLALVKDITAASED